MRENPATGLTSTTASHSLPATRPEVSLRQSLGGMGRGGATLQHGLGGARSSWRPE